jgi:ribonuclease HI
MGKSKIYVIARGKTPGVYHAWGGAGQAQAQVKGFPGAVYKSFPDGEQAKTWLDSIPGSHSDVMAQLQTIAPGPVKKTTSSRTGASKSSGAAIGHQADLDQGKAVIYTDGGCSGNPGPGGYAAVILQGDERKELSAGFRRTTNNRMEILACIAGLESLPPGSDVLVISDSKYTIDAMTKGWAKKWRAKNWMRTPTESAKNPDLWKRMLEICDERKVTFRWVKGHAGTEENERCDELAVAASKDEDMAEDTGFVQESKPMSLF